MSQDTPTPRQKEAQNETNLSLLVVALSARVRRHDVEVGTMKEGFAGLPDDQQGFAGLPTHLWPTNIPSAPVASARPELYKLAEGLRHKGEAEHAARSLQERGESHGLPGDVSPVARVGGRDDEDASADSLPGLPAVGDLDTTPFTLRADAFNIGEPRYPKTLTPVASAPTEETKKDISSRGDGE